MNFAHIGAQQWCPSSIASGIRAAISNRKECIITASFPGRLELPSQVCSAIIINVRPLRLYTRLSVLLGEIKVNFWTPCALWLATPQSVLLSTHFFWKFDFTMITFRLPTGSEQLVLKCSIDFPTRSDCATLQRYFSLFRRSTPAGRQEALKCSPSQNVPSHIVRRQCSFSVHGNFGPVTCTPVTDSNSYLPHLYTRIVAKSGFWGLTGTDR